MTSSTLSTLAYWKNSSILQEVVFQTALSGGKGGQHVNKTHSKVELYWNPTTSTCLSEEEKSLLLTKLKKQLSQEGTIRLFCQEHRSQLKNKQVVIEKFYSLLATSFKVKKNRKKSAPTKASIQKRLTGKSIRKEIKKGRQRPE